MTSETYHPRHQLTVREDSDGNVTIISGPVAKSVSAPTRNPEIRLTAEQARWVLRELEHLA